MVTLALCPLATFLQPPTRLQCLEGVIAHILSVPLLPYRLPIPALTELSSKLPYSSLDLLLPSIPKLLVIPTESRLHLIANLTMFTTPRYPKLSSKSLDAYIQLITVLLNSMPPGAFGRSDPESPKTSWAEDDSDSENAVVDASPTPAQAIFSSLDSRTQKRLQTLPSPGHVHALLLASQRCLPAQTSIISFLSTITTMWPAQKNKVLSAVVVYTAGGLVHELYQTYVGRSPVGSEDSPMSLIGLVLHTWSPHPP
jgi:ubiquitin-protein ligase E3 C